MADLYRQDRHLRESIAVNDSGKRVTEKLYYPRSTSSNAGSSESIASSLMYMCINLQIVFHRRPDEPWSKERIKG